MAYSRSLCNIPQSCRSGFYSKSLRKAENSCFQLCFFTSMQIRNGKGYEKIVIWCQVAFFMNFSMAKRLGRNLVYSLKFGPKSEDHITKNDDFLPSKSDFGPTQIASKRAYLLPKLALTCCVKLQQYRVTYHRMFLGRNTTSNAHKIAKSQKKK